MNENHTIKNMYESIGRVVSRFNAVEENMRRWTGALVGSRYAVNTAITAGLGFSGLTNCFLNVLEAHCGNNASHLSKLNELLNTLNKFSALRNTIVHSDYFFFPEFDFVELNSDRSRAGKRKWKTDLFRRDGWNTYIREMDDFILNTPAILTELTGIQEFHSYNPLNKLDSQQSVAECLPQSAGSPDP